ncbi:MAG: hypothetical protein JWQ27_1646 [Ferruginibacter sp.]|nr:hypothetical protein [Ferruginibacter sp.]
MNFGPGRCWLWSFYAGSFNRKILKMRRNVFPALFYEQLLTGTGGNWKMLRQRAVISNYINVNSLWMRVGKLKFLTLQ